VSDDLLPHDLDVTRYVGPFAFPDIKRRRTAALWYVGIAAVTGAGFAATRNGGLLAATIALVFVASYHVVAAWPLRVRETDALVAASRAVGFPVGHASAQLAWRGLRSRPTWRIVLYSADDPPAQRGLVEVDAVDGQVLGKFTEANPPG
jgi:hypothetical protein